MQNHYNLVYREEEREMFPTLKVSPIQRLHSAPAEHVSQHFNVASIPWSPLARGFLTRPLGKTTKRGGVDRYNYWNIKLGAQILTLFIVWSVVTVNMTLTRNFSIGKSIPFVKSPYFRTEPLIFERVENVAKDKGVSMAQIALAWCMHKEGTLFGAACHLFARSHNNCRSLRPYCRGNITRKPWRSHRCVVWLFTTIVNAKV